MEIFFFRIGGSHGRAFEIMLVCRASSVLYCSIINQCHFSLAVLSMAFALGLCLMDSLGREGKRKEIGRFNCKYKKLSST